MSPQDGKVPGFNEMEYALSHLKSKEFNNPNSVYQAIFTSKHSDSKVHPEADVIEVIKLMRDDPAIGNVKIAVLFLAADHTTPLCIEKNDGKIFVYNTDSTLFDADDAPIIRDCLIRISQLDGVKLYALGFYADATDKAFERQFDECSCSTFSLFDAKKMIETDFQAFLNKHGNVTQFADGGIININKLPASFMAVSQSVNGKAEGGVYIRKGLKQLLEDNPLMTTETLEKIDRVEKNLGELVDSIQNGDGKNTFIDQLNTRYYSIFEDTLGQPEKYNPGGVFISDIANVTEDMLIALSRQQTGQAEQVTEVVLQPA